MQEEIEHRAVTLAISTVKLTGRVLKAAIRQFLAALKKGRDSPKIPHGKQTVKELVRQNVGVSNIEITDSNIKSFERVARKYGVDFALKKDRKATPPKYLVFFKARDADALTAAFTEFTAKAIKARKPSVLARISKFKELIQNSVTDRAKVRSKGEREI